MCNLHKSIKIFTVLFLTAAVLILSACTGGGGGGGTPSTRTLQSIQVTPINPMVHLGSTIRLTATGIYSDNTTSDITSLVTWVSSNNAVALVSNISGSKGVLTPVTKGTTVVTASLEGISSRDFGDGKVIVSDAELTSIQVSAKYLVIAAGTAAKFTATGLYSDNSKQDITSSVSWTSSNTSVVTIADTTGIASSIMPGQTTITASSGNISGMASLTVTTASLVSIEVTADNLLIAKGTTAKFTATGIYSDNSRRDITSSVSWVSSDPTVATIANDTSIASAIALGQTTITAKSSDITSTVVTLKVSPATLVEIQITPVNPSVAKGVPEQFIATGIFSDKSTENLTLQV